MITDIELLKKDLVRIENIKSFLVDIPKLHPDHPMYDVVWKKYTKHCIEGFWAYDMGGYRFMPPTLFFYANFFKLEHSHKAKKQRTWIKPIIRDIDWRIHYAYLEAQGFSGFSKDDLYSGDIALINEDTMNHLKQCIDPEDRKRYLHLFKKDGTLKTYKPPREILYESHRDNLGKPKYYNPARNLMIFGCRGGGKSYSVAGITTQHLTFDGIKEYTKENFDNPQKITVVIGAADTKYSSDLIEKVTTALGLFATDQSLGAWGSPSTDDFTPNAFYRDWVGDTKPGAKNPFRYEYKVQTPGGGWTTAGSKTTLKHVNYSDKKANAATDAAGKRTALSIYEEVGLQSNFIDALLSNDATVKVDGEQFGVQLALGTSGDIDLVQQSKKVFTNPEEYNFLAFDNIWEKDSNKIGLFIPAYLSDLRFKDANGNTDVEKALKFFVDIRIEKALKTDPKILLNEKMNSPLVPSDMWVSNKGTYFPQLELMEREQTLLQNNYYKTAGTPVDLIWDKDSPNDVKWTPNYNAEPFYEFPFSKSMSNLNGAILIYHHPETISGRIPDDMYIHVFDPYVSENIEDGGSIGSFQTYLNPKYHKQGFSGTLVCSYHGKHEDGKKKMLENIEKIIAYYGNCPRSFWYEGNRGDPVRDYFILKNKTYILTPRPTRAKGSAAVERRVLEYGYYIGSKMDKIEMIDDASDWLLSKVIYKGKQVRVLDTIDDIFLIRQLSQFTMEGNFDAVMAMIGFPLALREIQHTIEAEERKKSKTNPLGAISTNPYLFNDAGVASKLKRYAELYETKL